MKLDEMLAQLPCFCSIGAKKASDGHNQYWRGYKLHLDVADGQIPISAVLTAAHVHDSQVAIPLIAEHVRSNGRVPIIDPKNVIVRNYPRQMS